MKLSEYANKKRILTPRKTSQFVLGNTAAESKLQDEVSNLNVEITRLRSVQQDRDDAVSKLTHEKIKLKEASIIFDKTKEENFLLHKNIEFSNKQIKELEKTKTLYKETSSKFSDLNNKFMLLQTQMSKKINDYDNLKKQTAGLQVENKQLTAETHQSNENKFSAEEERKQVLDKNTELKSFADKTSKINIGLREENKTFRDENNYHRKEAQEKLIALDESKLLESKLRGWLSALETTQSSTSSKNVGLNKKIILLQDTTKDMGNTIEQLVKEMGFLRELNKKYRVELGKPRYISMATIAKKENFTMPTEVVYRRSIGNAAQPLIKFKQEKKDDN
tara:strand:+ start:40 stop:1044 length:1005 start_codon:yes stop_codon:yes gene_type:complete